MRIVVVTAIGRGTTELGAFDHALTEAGVQDRNLIRLSSVIPPNTEIEVLNSACEETPGGWGDRLHVVYAEQRASKIGEVACAGIGWVQDPVTKKGLFVEHEGPNRDSVEYRIENSLDDLMNNRGIDIDSWERGKNVVEIECTESGLAVCALAVAIYQASDWDNNSYYLPNKSA